MSPFIGLCTRKANGASFLAACATWHAAQSLSHALLHTFFHCRSISTMPVAHGASLRPD